MNFIKKYYLNKWLRNFVQSETDRKITVYTPKDARSICFFICGDKVNKVEELIQCIKTEYKEKEITIICYLSNKKGFNIIDIPPFLHKISSKEVGITGRIKEGTDTLFAKQYDMLIDLDTKTNVISLYLKTLLKADFRIGGSQTDYAYFDFVLCADEQRSIKDYLFNLEVYTSKLKGI